ncbi:MAG: hypothetical protein ACK4S4_05190 [Pyrinomonadaceae bacterium]
MPNTSILCGILLIVVGVAGYAYGVSTGSASITALIPAVFGLVLALLGAMSRGNEGLRKHLMHAAAAVALIGFILTAGRLVMKLGEISMTPAVLSQLAMAAICLVFVILAVKSFADARRSRQI